MAKVRTTLRQSSGLAVPQGSTILVTGISGMIGTHIADEALKAGFRVRGTTRSEERVKAVKTLFGNNDGLEVVVVKDMAAEAAFDEAAKGVSAIIHSASVTAFMSRPEDVIPPTVAGTMNIMRAATLSEDVKRVVITSSTGAAAAPRPGVEFSIDQDLWNDAAIATVKSATPLQQTDMGIDWPYSIYAASNVESERAAWRYMQEERPRFELNVVCPAMNWGKLKGSTGISGGQIFQLFKGIIPDIPSVYMIDTVDDARIHVGAVIDPEVRGERIFAASEPFTWKKVIEILSRAMPSASLPTSDPDELADLSSIDTATGRMLLQKWWGQSGYKGLEQTVLDTLEMYEGQK